MANQINIDIGAAANDGTGDPLRTAFNYVNNNFSNVWNTGLPTSNIQFSDNRILTVNTNANLVLAPNGIGVVQSNVDILPSINRVQSLGSSSKKWNSVNTYYINADSANIGSFGNLTVAVANLHITGGSNGYVLQTDGAGNLTWTAQTGGGGNGVPGGANTQVQYNNAGSFGGSASFTFNQTSNVLTVSGNISAGNISVSNLTTTSTVYGTNGTFTGDQYSDGAMYIGSPAGTVLGSDVVIQVTSNAGGYSQTNFQNISNSVTASSDYILTADNGNDTTHFIDLGMTSSTWDDSEPNVLDGLTPNNGYLYVQDGNLTMGTRNGAISHTWNFDLSGNVTIPGDVLPVANNVQSLGSATQQWNDLYLSNATIYMNSVPISLTSGNVLTVDGNDVVTTAANGESRIGNLDISGTLIEIAAGAPETSIDISPSGPVAGWAYLQLPTNDTANTADTRLHNDAGNIEFGTGDFSTGETNYIWTLDTDGRMTIPGIIFSSNTIEINNQATSNTADIRLNSADDIFLQGRDKPDDLEAEGGDIFVYGGDGADAATSGFDTGGGGDVQIEGGLGGTGFAAGTGGGGGGIITIAGGDGGSSTDSTVGSGGSVNISAGTAADPISGDPALGGLGGGVNISAGDTTRINENGGSIELSTGGATVDGTGAAGYVAINIPNSNVGPGGNWTFMGTGTTLNVPANAEIFGANAGNLTVGCAGNTIITSSDYGANIQNWVFGYQGQTIFPTLTVTRGDRTGTLTGQTLLFGDSTQEAIISTPDGTNDINASQRFVINPGKGADGTTGEGGDIYLYAGRGGDAGGSGGDIKIRGGLAPLNGAGGYITMEGGEASADGVGGYIEIYGGVSGNSTGGYLDLQGGLGQIEGGAVFIQGGQGQAGPGGPVNITGGVSGLGLAEYGNVGVIAGASSWVFDNTGNLTLPNDSVVYETNIPFGGLEGKTIALKPYGGTDADQQLLVYPTAGADFNHLHLTTGNLWNTEMFLGNDDFYVKLANTGNIVINTNDNTGNTAQWTFGTEGTILNSGNLTLQTPNGVPGAVTAITGSSGSWESNPVTNLATTGGTGTGLTVNVTQEGGYAGTITIATPGTGYSNGDAISVVSGSSSASFTISVLANGWTLDTAGNLTVAGSIIMPPGTSLTGTGASPAPSINGFSTISSETVRAVSISVEGGRINGGFSTVVTDGINSIAQAPGAQMDVYGFPFTGGGVRGQLTISGVTTPSEANGTWYYQSINTYTYQIYTNSTYSTLVDASGWSAYTGSGSVAITMQDPASNVVINSNGYFSTFDNTGKLNLPGDLDVDGNITGNTAGYAIGFRDIPQVSFAGDTTIATTDAGKHYYSTESTDYTLTIANNASQGFQVGSAITVVNQGTGNITIAQGSGVTLYMAGNATSGNRSVATFGMATIMKVATNTWFVSGVGVA